MEEAILTRLLEISIYSAAVFLVVWLFRTAFSKALSPMLKYALWFLVVLRLCLPVTFESGVHLFTLDAATAAQTAEPAATVAEPVLQDNAATAESAAIQTDETTQAQTQPQTQPGDAQLTPAAAAQKTPLNWRQWLVLVWIGGAVVMLGIGAGLMLRLGRRIRRLGCEPGERTQALYDEVKTKMHIGGHIPLVLMPDIHSPALTVEPRPKLLLPDRLIYQANAENMAFAMAHELMHYKRRDYLVCLLLLILRAVYWFNPVSWLLLHMMRLDMETACDSMVVSRFDREQKLSYINLLLSLGEESTQAALHLKGGE